MEIKGKIRGIKLGKYALIEVETDLLQDGPDFTTLINEPVSLIIDTPDSCLREKKEKGCGLPF